MARLPIPGADDVIWGNLLNEFLTVEHNSDGTLKLNGTLAGKYAKPASGIPKSHLASDVQASLSKADVSASTIGGLQDVQVSNPVVGQVLTYDDTSAAWINTDLDVTNMTARSVSADITKYDIGLGNVTNEAQLPLTGGTLTGDVRINDGKTLRAYHTDNSKYIELKADNYWSRINAGGTSGLVLNGSTVQIDAATVFNNGVVRSLTNLATSLGTSSYYFSNLYAQKHFFNANASIDGAAPGRITVLGGLSQNEPISSGSGDYISTMMQLDMSAGFTGNGFCQAVNPRVTNTTVGWVIGTKYNPRTFGNASITGKMSAFYAVPEHGSTGAVNDMIGAEVHPYITSSGSVSNLYYFKGRAKSGSGTNITNAFGLHLDNINVGTSANYAIYTNAGKVHFGDDVDLTDGKSISTGTSLGLKIGTAANQKLGFFNATPVAQQAGGALTASTSYGSNEQQMMNKMWTALRNLGLID